MIQLRRPSAPHRIQAAYENVLGTSLELHIVAASESTGREAELRILAEIDRLEGIFSVFRDSEFLRWQQSFGEPMTVSLELGHVLAEAERWRIISEGAFLPTVEALTLAWRSGQVSSNDSALDMPMWSVDQENCTATRLTEHPASLNAIAKGFIIDRAIEVAREVDTVRQLLVNIGGDLRHWGEGAVNVAISDPERPEDNCPPKCTVRLSNQAIATSGGYRRGFWVGAEWYSHIFDPKTSQPATSILSASVIAPTAMGADIAATVLSVLEPSTGMALVEAQESMAAFVVDQAGTCHQSARWKF